MSGSSHRRHFRRLFGYVFAHRDLLALVIVAGAVVRALPFVYPNLIGILIDQVIAPRGTPPSVDERTRNLWWLIAAAAATAVAFGLGGFAAGHFNVKLGNRIVTHIRRDLFDHLQRLSLHFYHKERTGGIVWRLIHEVHGVNGIAQGTIITVGLDLIQLAIALWLLIKISASMTFAVLLILPLYVLTFKFFNPHVRKASEVVGQHLGRFSGNVQEQLSAIALIKTFAAEERESRRFGGEAETQFGHVMHQSKVGHAVGAISETLIHLGTTIIIAYGGYLALHGAKPLTAGQITQFLGYVGILYGPVKRFADLNLQYQNSLASVRRVFRVFDINPKIQEAPKAVTTAPAMGAVEYEGVRFHYAEECDESRVRLDEDEPEDSPFRITANGKPHRAPRWVLDGVDFAVEPGQRVALVGPSGAGKTTVGALLPRLYDVVQGRILVDGIDIRNYSLKALRQSIAVVQQESFLFSGTIRENLLYGRPEATEQEMFAAAQAANAHGFITDLPDGYDTVLGERGVNLSGGQRQRLSIARAILKDPKILILDEATSALDAESEVLVQQALNRLMRGRTCLIIAHRLSTVRNADRILVLKEGRIAEAGRHDELIARDGLYAKLVRHQFSHHATHAPGHPAILTADGEPNDTPRRATPARRKKRRARSA